MMSLQRGREAAERGDWAEAYDALVKADADGLAGPADLPLLGEVAYAAGHLDVAIEAWERAHAVCLKGCRHIPSRAASERVNATIRALLRGLDGP